VTKRSIIALFAAVAVLGAAPAFALSARSDAVTLLAAKKKKHVVSRARAMAPPQGEIACGPAGCHRIPPNCHIQGTALDWRGNPTGIDAVYCR
jgi:hypothetical protein